MFSLVLLNKIAVPSPDNGEHPPLDEYIKHTNNDNREHRPFIRGVKHIDEKASLIANERADKVSKILDPLNKENQDEEIEVGETETVLALNQ